jgi:hypothetical protein
MTLFIRAVAAEDKSLAIKRSLAGELTDRFTPQLSQFKELPGTPFAYWVGAGVRAAFQRFPTVEGDERAVRQGLATADDFRFLRAQWEINPGDRGRKWFPFAKGGELSPFYAEIHLVVNWEYDGLEIKNFMDIKTGKVLSRPQNIDYYFRPGLTWPLRASRFAPQPLPAGCIFSVRGYSVFLPEDLLLPALSIFNSKAFDYLFKALLGRFGYPEFIVGVLQKLPWAEPSSEQAKHMAALARSAWSAARTVNTAVETSLAFTLPRFLNGLASAPTEAEAADLQSKVDGVAFELFGLNESDKSEIEGAAVFASAEIIEDEEEKEEDSIDAAGTESSQFSLQSWSVGVAFGRFDIRLATGERLIPPEPEPFDALPHRSPGMLPDGTSSFMPCRGILIDDPGHADDLVARIIAVYDRAGQQSPDSAALRRSLARDFFPAHLKMYTMSRRKAPLYWQLGTPTTSYSIWLYLHALNKDTLFRIQSDYVTPKLTHEQRRLDGLRADAGPNPSASQRKAIEGQDLFVGELQAFLEEVKRVAPLWNPNLDDGVVLLMAPLWRLVPQFKPWQKELKTKWDELVIGKYDWSHAAMHLWPERVVPKCAIDRSLAIAHGLEDVFWVEGHDGKSKPRQTPKRPIDEIVRERSSVAVKAALNELVDASAQTSSKGRTRRPSS